MNTELYIENELIELNDDVQFAITKQFENLSNPTTIINDWSKTVEIPFTAHNNRIFGNIYNAGKTIVSNAVNYADELERSFTTIGDGAYDDETNTLRFSLYNSPYSVNVSNIQIVDESLKVYKTITSVGIYSQNFQSSVGKIGIRINASPYSPTIWYDLSNIPYNETYNINFNVLQYDISDSHNVNISIANIVINKGSSPVYWDTITSKLGVYFNPLQKLDFRLLWNNMPLMNGYAKMNEIKQTNGKGTYNLTLYGKLGEVFYEMKKITFDTTTDEPKYLIDGSKYVNTRLNRNLIADCWNKVSFAENLNNAGVLDIIGFAPNNSFDEDFDYSSVQSPLGGAATFASLLDSTDFKDKTGVEGGSVIKDGLLPREFGEYRSYLQLPYIYFNKLFQIVQNKVEETTGYAFDLDNKWFYSGNPYWRNLVMMLSRPYDNKEKENYNNYYYFGLQTGIIQWGSDWSAERTATLGISTAESSKKETYPLLEYTTFSLTDKNESVVIDRIPFRLRVPAYYKDSKRQPITWSKNRILTCRINVIDADSNNVLQTYYQKIKTSASGIALYDDIIIDETSTELNASFNQWEFSINPIAITYDIPANTRKIKVQFAFSWNGTGTPFNGYQPSSQGTTQIDVVNSVVETNVKTNYGSNQIVTLNDFWYNDYKPFDVILNYCKIFRIKIVEDSVNKVIKFLSPLSYFNNYTISNWNSKLDMTKDYSIRPVSIENKYVKFNYEDSELKGQKEYKEKYSANNGEKIVNTEYVFNNETKDLFEGLATSINNTDNVLSWNSLYTDKTIVYTYPNEYYILCKDDENKYVKQFGNFFFYLGVKDFDTNAPMTSVRVSDDTAYQQSNSVNCYSGNFNFIEVAKYPLLSTVGYNKICLFNKPMLSYTRNIDYDGKLSIYDTYWKAYFNERYNIQNKVVSCYLWLTPYDYINFKFNNFIMLDNQLYMINKIENFDVSSNTSTKVELISIQDIAGYMGITKTLDVNENIIRFTQDETQETTVEIISSSNWNITQDKDYQGFSYSCDTYGKIGINTLTIKNDRIYSHEEQQLTINLTITNNEGVTQIIKIYIEQ